MRDKLYAMGLIETFCFIYTTGKDWWFIEDDMLIYTDKIFMSRSHITTTKPSLDDVNLMGPSK